MQTWGRELARVLKTGDVVALIGDLGAGKTTLVQGIAAGWGYTRRANSPTFALVNEYHSPRGLLLHMDMYRLSAKELTAFPLEDYLDSHAACVIEWADRVHARWPKETLEIRIKTLNPMTREIEFYHPSTAWKKRLHSFFEPVSKTRRRASLKQVQ
jgi:tRNA threonylcarbamoyladenosine biosynthesis protein TsaE